MKKSIFCLSMVFCNLLLLLSCNKPSDQNPDGPPAFKVDKTSLTLGGAIDMKDTLTVTSSGPWSLTISPNAPSWFSINRTSGNGDAQVILTAAEINRSGNTRTATLTLTPSASSTLPAQSITVMQRNFSMQDSAAILLGRWKLVKDSSTNIGGYYFTYQGQTGFQILVFILEERQITMTLNQQELLICMAMASYTPAHTNYIPITDLSLMIYKCMIREGLLN